MIELLRKWWRWVVVHPFWMMMVGFVITFSGASVAAYLFVLFTEKADPSALVVASNEESVVEGEVEFTNSSLSRLALLVMCSILGPLGSTVFTCIDYWTTESELHGNQDNPNEERFAVMLEERLTAVLEERLTAVLERLTTTLERCLDSILEKLTPIFERRLDAILKERVAVALEKTLNDVEKNTSATSAECVKAEAATMDVVSQ